MKKRINKFIFLFLNIIVILFFISKVSALSSCTDSDNGVNYYTNGITNWTFNEVTYFVQTDICCTAPNCKWLTEWECSYFSGEQRWYGIRTYYNCPNGCENGACKGTPNATEINATPCDPPTENPAEWCVYAYGNNVKIPNPTSCESTGMWGYVSNCSSSSNGKCARLSSPDRHIIYCFNGCNKGVCLSESEDNPQNNTTTPPNNTNTTNSQNNTNITNPFNNITNPLSQQPEDTTQNNPESSVSSDIPDESTTITPSALPETNLNENVFKDILGKPQPISSFSVNNTRLIGPSGTIVESEAILAKSSTGSIYAKAGEKYIEIKVDPANALDKAKQILKTENIGGIKIKELNEKIVYEISSEKQVKILALIKSDMNIKANINVEDINIIGIKRPWWSFLAF